MTKALGIAGAFLLVAAQRAASGPQDPDLGPAREYRVLYAGQPGGEREARFLEFLRRWFSRVDSISLEKLDSKAAASHDVVIADWGRRYVDGKYSSASTPRGKLGEDFARPVVMIGAVAGEIQHRTKINWL